MSLYHVSVSWGEYADRMEFLLGVFSTREKSLNGIDRYITTMYPARHPITRINSTSDIFELGFDHDYTRYFVITEIVLDKILGID